MERREEEVEDGTGALRLVGTGRPWLDREEVEEERYDVVRSESIPTGGGGPKDEVKREDKAVRGGEGEDRLRLAERG